MKKEPDFRAIKCEFGKQKKNTLCHASRVYTTLKPLLLEEISDSQGHIRHICTCYQLVSLHADFIMRMCFMRFCFYMRYTCNMYTYNSNPITPKHWYNHIIILCKPPLIQHTIALKSEPNHSTANQMDLYFLYMHALACMSVYTFQAYVNVVLM